MLIQTFFFPFPICHCRCPAAVSTKGKTLMSSIITNCFNPQPPCMCFPNFLYFWSYYTHFKQTIRHLSGFFFTLSSRSVLRQCWAFCSTQLAHMIKCVACVSSKEDFCGGVWVNGCSVQAALMLRELAVDQQWRLYFQNRCIWKNKIKSRFAFFLLFLGETLHSFG